MQLLYKLCHLYSKYDSFLCQYELQTARLYIQKYSRFHMLTGAHKILIHRSKIISAAIPPTGQLSKEAQESRKKGLKATQGRLQGKIP